MLEAESVATEATPIDSGTAGQGAASASAPSQDTGASSASSLDDELLDVWVKNNVPADKQETPKTGKPEARGPTRAADGKFATPAPLNQAAQQVSADPPNEAAAPAAIPAPDLPQSWSAEMKAKAAALPPEAHDVLKYAALRDKQQHTAISKAGEIVKQYEDRLGGYKDFDQILDHYKPEFARRGVAPAQAFATLMQAQSMLDANPADGLVRIAATYGIDLRQALYGPGSEQQQPDPVVAQLKGQVQQLQSQLAQYGEKFSQSEAEQARAAAEAKAREDDALQNEIHTFASDKPYLEDVRTLMAALLRDGQAKGLSDAYDMAVHAHPQIRAKIAADRLAKEEAARAAEAKSKAEAARKAAAVNVRGAPAGTSPRTMDDDLREIAARHYSK